MKNLIFVGVIALTTLIACQSENNEVIASASKTENSNAFSKSVPEKDAIILMPNGEPVTASFLINMKENTGLDVTGRCTTIDYWHTEYIHTYTVSCGGNLWQVMYYEGYGWGSPREL